MLMTLRMSRAVDAEDGLLLMQRQESGRPRPSV